MKLTNINKENNTFVLVNKIKHKQQYYFTFFLDNKLSCKSLNLYYNIKLKYIWLLQAQLLNLLEGHIFINLNHLEVDLKVSSLNEMKRLDINITFLDYDLKNRFQSISDVIKSIFTPIDLTLLSERNNNLLKNYVSGYLKSQKMAYNKIEINKNHDLNQLFTTLDVVLDKDGYSEELYNLEQNEFMNNFSNEVIAMEKSFNENVIQIKQLQRVASLEYVINITKKFNSKETVSTETTNFNVQKTQEMQYNFKDFVSSSEIYLHCSNLNSIKNKIIYQFFVDVIWNFYFDVIREKHQLIYSPNIKSICIEPNIIKINNSTQNINIAKLVKLEKDFLSNIKSYFTKEMFSNFKLSLLSEFENACDNLDLNFYYTLAYYFDDFNRGEYELKNLENWYLKQIANLTYEDVTRSDFKCEMFLQQITKGE